MIKLNITRTATNPHFKEELESYNKRDNYPYNSNREYPKVEIDSEILISEITDAQFEAIRKAVLEQF